MHPHPAFRWQDKDAMRDFVRQMAFGALFASTSEGPRVAHMPVTWEGDERLTFHLSLGNDITKHLDGATGLLVVHGPDAYVSPDWYDEGPAQVPTWNYVAVELEGRVSALSHDALVAQIDALAAEHEARLSPKPIWTRAKMEAERFEKMTRAIQGFALDVTDWRGTRKLAQTKSQAARLSAADALDGRGDREMARLMRDA
ncbi:FMN-binding negative transcriptional regulator [Sphingomonas sp. AX6]|uniref:FMN-binding negative transcriptional regulator n=1 Tax=Sphingomonas sp. AX6 TaxID=2653171 RepID=UPI0012EF90B3|nr:FMN-binding negative transcriptional regulator [Sphingomonas sp. AX6]VXD00610.1 Negative transcriptional regulator [Sphingomonas sp. AX6]